VLVDDSTKVPDTPAARQHPVQRAIVRFDAEVDRALDLLRGRAVPDRVFYTASELGDFSLLWHLLATTQGLRRGGDLAGTLRVMAAMSVESAVVNGPVKGMFRRTRPVSDVPRPHRLRTPKTTSFPSGHASAATVFAIVAGEDDPLRPLYLALAGTVALSRVYVRIHYASDVVGGALAGAAIGSAWRRLWPAGQRLPLRPDR
jgi:undecaprenyl-diphosphatase